MVINRFWFSNGDSAGSLEELMGKLKVIDDECFAHHVNEEKNDIAAWIESLPKGKVLAKNVGKLKDRVEIIYAIDKKINTPAKIKNRIIAQIKGEILDGTS